MAIHFCGGNINKIAFSEHDANCGMEEVACTSASFTHSSNLKKADNCCENQLIKASKLETVKQKDLSEIATNSFTINWLLPQTDSKLFVDEPLNRDYISLHNQRLPLFTKYGAYLFYQNFRI